MYNWKSEVGIVMHKSKEERYLEAVDRNLDAVVNSPRLMAKYRDVSSVKEIKHKIGIRKNDKRFDNDPRLEIIRTG